MKAMAAASPLIHLTTYGYTVRGRPMPLAVIGARRPLRSEVLATGKTRIYIRATSTRRGRRQGSGRSGLCGRSRRASAPPGSSTSSCSSTDLQRRRQRARERAQPRQPVRPDRRHGPARQRENLDSTATTRSSKPPRRGPLARLLTQYDPHIAIDLHCDERQRSRLLPHLRNVGEPNTSPASPGHPATKIYDRQQDRKRPIIAVTKATKKDGSDWTIWTKAMPLYMVRETLSQLPVMIRDVTATFKDVIIRDESQEAAAVLAAEVASKKSSKPAGKMFDKILGKASAFYKEGVLLYIREKNIRKQLLHLIRPLKLTTGYRMSGMKKVSVTVRWVTISALSNH